MSDHKHRAVAEMEFSHSRIKLKRLSINFKPDRLFFPNHRISFLYQNIASPISSTISTTNSTSTYELLECFILSQNNFNILTQMLYTFNVTRIAKYRHFIVSGPKASQNSTYQTAQYALKLPANSEN